MTGERLVIGVDGGGTKTLAWLASAVDNGSGAVLGRGLAGPGNPRAVGFEVAQANIAAAIAAAFADAARSPAQVAAACFGLAGAGRADEQARIATWATSAGIARHVRVCGDAELVLAAATHERAGVALICGTGSLAWGRSAAGQTARCGGWGYLLGDEGSGYAIALAGLRAAARATDGRGTPTELLALFQKQLGAGEPHELIARVYAPEMTRERLAALAPIVFEAAATDAVAQRIVKQAAGELTDLVSSVVWRLDLEPHGYTLAVAGGTILHGLNYLQGVVANLTDGEDLPSQVVLVEEPVRGAVALARALAGAAEDDATHG
ncbi:MAG: BadF/BadG/BcrA/BcrD ATPase family protein [Pirellulaceae bacterium]